MSDLALPFLIIYAEEDAMAYGCFEALMSKVRADNGWMDGCGWMQR
jgi:hypothetical protein